MTIPFGIRVGAAVAAGFAVAWALTPVAEPGQARHESPAHRAAASRDDPLHRALRACSRLGERALHSPRCRAAWAEKRRVFFGAAPVQER